jgi:hypothetical protein
VPVQKIRVRLAVKPTLDATYDFVVIFFTAAACRDLILKYRDVSFEISVV